MNPAANVPQHACKWREVEQARKMYHRFKWTRASHRRNGISQEYEPVQPYFLLALIKATNCKTFVDVGANIGAYSVLMSEAVDNVIAFEANANAANEMARNLSVNNLQAQIIRKAASSRNGTVSFGTVSRLAGNSAVVATSAGQNFRQTSELESVTLDAILSEQAEPFAIKIDVEGHEKEVLAGATRTLSRRCVIQIEDHKGTLELGREPINPGDHGSLSSIVQSRISGSGRQPVQAG